METYRHGVYISEKEEEKNTSTMRAGNGVTVVVGTAPINLAEDPNSVTNKVMLINDLEEAKKKLGYSNEYSKYTLCQSMITNFVIFGISPVVFINVLDPKKHKKDMTEKVLEVAEGKAILNEKDVLLESIVVKNEEGTVLEEDKYTAYFSGEGNAIIELTEAAGSIASIKVTCDVIDSTKVTKEDVIGGYNAETGIETGLGLVRQVYPKLQKIPETVIAPKWSGTKEVAAVMELLCRKINTMFSATALIDIDTSKATKFSDVEEQKEALGIKSKYAIALWPKVKLQYDSENYDYSSVFAPLMQYYDIQNGNVPVNPSNKALLVEALVDAKGKEIVLDKEQADDLNGIGIVTALNLAGFKTWGNNTTAYPEDKAVKNRYIPCRRFFNWWGNEFVLTYITKVDDNANFRLIQEICDDENYKIGAYAAEGKCAGGKIEYNQEENPIEKVLDGNIKFRQKLAPFTPAEVIENELEFDPTLLQAAIGGEAVE